LAAQPAQRAKAVSRNSSSREGFVVTEKGLGSDRAGGVAANDVG